MNLAIWPFVIDKQGQQGPNGTVYNMVKEPILKLWPPDELGGVLAIPDEDDQVVVDGERFRVIDVEIYKDAGSGDFRGARIQMRTMEQT